MGCNPTSPRGVLASADADIRLKSDAQSDDPIPFLAVRRIAGLQAHPGSFLSMSDRGMGGGDAGDGDAVG